MTYYKEGANRWIKGIMRSTLLRLAVRFCPLRTLATKPLPFRGRLPRFLRASTPLLRHQPDLDHRHARDGRLLDTIQQPHLLLAGEGVSRLFQDGRGAAHRRGVPA